MGEVRHRELVMMRCIDDPYCLPIFFFTCSIFPLLQPFYYADTNVASFS